MGKTQSKRSVDITTDSKSVSKDAEFPDKMEKIDDITEQKEVVNGDTIMTEKFSQDVSENVKYYIHIYFRSSKFFINILHVSNE